jgi:hypothetical protein
MPTTNNVQRLLASPLYKVIAHRFPAYTYNPFDPNPQIDTVRLAKTMGRSSQAVYGWFRKSRLTPNNAKDICELCRRDNNLTILKILDREPLTLDELIPFIFGE